MLTKSMFVDDGIIELLIALYYNSFHLYLSRCRDLRVCTGFRGGWEQGGTVDNAFRGRRRDRGIVKVFIRSRILSAESISTRLHRL
jgi:hypothetical protein